METKIKDIELEAFFLSELEPDIHTVSCKNIEVTKMHYEEVIKEQMLMSGGKKVGVVFDAGSIKKITHEARNYVSTTYPEYVWGTAFIAQTPIAQMIASFFLIVTKPAFPTKVFSDFDSAKHWILQLRNEQK